MSIIVFLFIIFGGYMYAETLRYFDALTRIPRASHKEAGVRRWLIQYATDNGLRFRIDTVGNVVIYVPGSPGFERITPLVIQTHQDMVTVKDNNSLHDFLTDRIRTYVTNDGWVRARGTTLGADNGLGLSLSLVAKDVLHPPLELVFTVDEEDGFTGAEGFNKNLLSGNRLLNLDGENDQQICIGSAWSTDAIVTKNYTPVPATLAQYSLSITQGLGGHSGLDIHRHRGNIPVSLMQLLRRYPGKRELVSIEGGQALNAIPTECAAIVGIDNLEQFEAFTTLFIERQREKYANPKLSFSLDSLTDKNPVVENPISLLETIVRIPVGVSSMHPNIPDLTQVSINLGKISLDDGTIALGYLHRSAGNPSSDALLQQVQSHYVAHGFGVAVKSSPPRLQDANDPFVQLIVAQYRKTVPDASLVTLHCGLEAGTIAEKYTPALAAVCIGPTIVDLHSIYERFSLSSLLKVTKGVENILFALLHV